MIGSKNIKVNTFGHIGDKTVINGKEEVSYVLRRDVPMEVHHKKVILYDYKTFELIFKSEQECREFVSNRSVY